MSTKEISKEKDGKALNFTSDPLELDLEYTFDYTEDTGVHGRLESELELPREKKDRISSLPEFQTHAAANQWKTRRERGLPWKQDVFEYVRDVYGPWIDRGVQEGRPLTQADIRAVDAPLYKAFHQEVWKRGVPDWLSIPSEKDATLSAVEDPQERQMLEELREHERERKRLRKALKSREV